MTATAPTAPLAVPHAHLTPEVATKLLLTRPWHRVTYTYARESRGSAPPYRVVCSCGWDAGWLRCTLRVALELARCHVEPAALTSPASSPATSALPLSATTGPATPLPALRHRPAPTRPASSLPVAFPAPHAEPTPTLPPCALDAHSAAALALDWLARGD